MHPPKDKVFHDNIIVRKKNSIPPLCQLLFLNQVIKLIFTYISKKQWLLITTRNLTNNAKKNKELYFKQRQPGTRLHMYILFSCESKISRIFHKTSSHLFFSHQLKHYRDFHPNTYFGNPTGKIFHPSLYLKFE